MQHDEFIGQVQDRARLPSRGSAERATRATLETLAERVPEGLADNIAAQLPHEIGEHLRRTLIYGGEGTGGRFDLPSFVDRVAMRSEVEGPQATFEARVVLEVLDEATQGGVMEKLRASLPDDIEQLVDSGSEGTMNAETSERR